MDGAPRARTGGLVAVILREYRRMTASPFYLLSLLILPAAGALIVVAIFGTGVLRDLPVAVVDEDHSAISRQLTRMIDASPGLLVAYSDPSPGIASARVLRGEVYAVVVIPRALATDVARNGSSRVQVFYNNQYLVPASAIRRDMSAIVGTLSATAELGRRAGAGQPVQAAAELVEPIVVDTHTLSNPALSYVPYLVVGLLPTLLQIFVMVAAAHAFGVELKDRTAGDWIDAAGRSGWRAAAGKTLPYLVHFTALGLLMLWALFGWLGIPFAGHVGIVAAATVLLVMAYLGMGLLAVALTANLRFATSLVAFYSAPAFAFAGLTFPVAGMPAAGQAWSSLLPVTHYIHLLMGQALRGAPIDTTTRPLQVLLAFAVIPWLAGAWRMGALARNPRVWGRR